MLFIEPPMALDYPDIHPRHPPHFAAYAAGLVEEQGCDVALLDAFHEGLDLAETVRRAAALRPEVVLILPFDYTRETPVEMSLAVAAGLRPLLPEAWIGLAGSTDPDYLTDALGRAPAIDFAVVGELELPCVDLALARRDGRGFDQVQSLLVRNGDGIVDTGPARWVDDLDTLPFPAWHLVDFPSYVFIPHRYRYAPFYPVLAGRGCPFGCLTCKEARVSKITRHRLRSVDNVLGEIHHAVEHHGAREIQFSDATFGLDRAWTHELCDALMERGPGIPWSALSRVDVMTPDLLNHMARAGCWNLLYGIESGNEDSLARINKGITLDQVRTAIRATRQAGIEATASFILGLPGETEQHVRRTIEFAVEIEPDYAQFFLLKFIGQDSDLSAWGRFTDDWDFGRYDFRGPVFIPSAFDDLAQLKRWQKRAYRRFYFRLSYLRRMLPQLIRQGQPRRLWAGARIALRAAVKG